jgi:hypothetical protein
LPSWLSIPKKIFRKPQAAVLNSIPNGLGFQPRPKVAHGFGQEKPDGRSNVELALFVEPNNNKVTERILWIAAFHIKFCFLIEGILDAVFNLLKAIPSHDLLAWLPILFVKF